MKRQKITFFYKFIHANYVEQSSLSIWIFLSCIEWQIKWISNPLDLDTATPILPKPKIPMVTPWTYKPNKRFGIHPNFHSFLIPISWWPWTIRLEIAKIKASVRSVTASVSVFPVVVTCNPFCCFLNIHMIGSCATWDNNFEWRSSWI